MTTTTPSPDPQGIGQTVRSDTLRSPLRDFLHTETGSAVVLVAASVAALLWANTAPGSYDRLWEATLSVRLGSVGVALELREWVNSGLMALFFFVVGLEARREFDMGELRQRHRMALPLLAGVMGMLVPVLIFLAFAVGSGAGRGWGVAMSTDTAFALGMLALLGKRLPDTLRTFLVTVAIVDDVVALAVIAIVYSSSLSWQALLAACAVFAVVVVIRRAGVRHGVPYVVLGVGLWFALLQAGIDPVVTGLALAMITYAYPASRSDLSRRHSEGACRCGRRPRQSSCGWSSMPRAGAWMSCCSPMPRPPCCSAGRSATGCCAPRPTPTWDKSGSPKVAASPPVSRPSSPWTPQGVRARGSGLVRFVRSGGRGGVARTVPRRWCGAGCRSSARLAPPTWRSQNCPPPGGSRPPTSSRVNVGSTVTEDAYAPAAGGIPRGEFNVLMLPQA